MPCSQHPSKLSPVSLYVDQATSHTIIVDAVRPDGSVFDLTGFTVIFSTHQYDLPCEVDGGTVTALLRPEHTNIDSTSYQIRAFKDEEIYQIIQGRLTVSRALVNPYLEPPV